MSLLSDRIKLLEADLKEDLPRISVYHDLPFAIFRYDPDEEWTLRHEARLLVTRLEEAGKTTEIIHLSDLLWKAVEETEGIEAVIELEKGQDFLAAQGQLTTYLSDRDWRPLDDLLKERLQSLNQSRDVVFLMRAAAMAPGIYHMSKLLDQMQGKTSLTTVLFYPGTIEGTTGLRFMALKDCDAWGNYRVKIYG